MLLRFLSVLFLCLGFANVNAQINSSVTFAKKNKPSKTFVAHKGYYCSCIPVKGRGAEGLLIGADSNNIYVAKGKILLDENDSVNLYPGYAPDSQNSDWVTTDTLVFPIKDLYRVVAYPLSDDTLETKADKFIDYIMEPSSHSTHAGSFFGQCLIGFTLMLFIYPTEYVLHMKGNQSLDMRIWEVKK